MNETVLRIIEAHALTPEAVEQVIRLTERDDLGERHAALTSEQHDIDTKLKRLTTAIETEGDVATLVARIRKLEARQRGIRADLASLQPVPRLDAAIIENRLTEWRRLLRQSTTQGRAVLQRVLSGRLTFTPRVDGQGYDFSGPTRFDKLFTGLVARRPAWMDPNDRTGTEEIHAEYDADYGRLLEQACGKGGQSPRGVEPV